MAAQAATAPPHETEPVHGQAELDSARCRSRFGAPRFAHVSADAGSMSMNCPWAVLSNTARWLPAGPWLIAARRTNWTLPAGSRSDASPVSDVEMCHSPCKAPLTFPSGTARHWCE